MTKIGLLSDTHGYVDDKLFDFFGQVDQIWHAGDLGSLDVLDKLSEKAILKAVYGNIDDQKIRNILPEHQRFICEEKSVWITHIGGYPNNYDFKIRNEIYRNPPDIFISGHSHILKVINDKKLNLLHINPGAYGKNGLHKFRTAIKFIIDKDNISDMQVLEIVR
ncbi:MAG: metallophosphoesterase family protein [Bacteroidota bacterium]